MRTPAVESRYEPAPIKGSRFIATAVPATTRDEAEAAIRRVAKEFDDARHVCWAWRIGADGSDERSADDGEPAGSAGRPILAQLGGHDVSDVVAIVVRYFGGVKLGVGGLMRAYGGAVGQCLDRTELVDLRVMRRVAFAYPYECEGAVQGLLSAENLEPTAAEYGANVRLEVEVLEERLVSFLRALADRTAGRATLE